MNKKNDQLESFNTINDLKKELFKLRFQKSLGELKNTSLFSKIRKKIARLNTQSNIKMDGSNA